MEERITRVEFVRGRRSLASDRWYAKLIYVLRGSAEVLVNEASWSLSCEDGPACVANTGEPIRIMPAADTLVALIAVDMRQVRRLINDRPLTIFCNPTLCHQASYAELIGCAESLLHALTESGDFSSFHVRLAELSLVRCLVDSFGGTVSQAPSRAEAFANYLDSHFNEPLNLAQLARHFHLSTEHFAKVFKAEMGMTFHAYLTGLRLDAATERLTSGDDTVSRIALDAGFPNTAAFNQAFKDRFGTTPTSYRRVHAESTRANFSAALASELQARVVPVEAAVADELSVNVDARSNLVPLHESWRDTIGLGRIESLSDARVQEQALWLKRHLAFAHYRVGCHFSKFEDQQFAYQLDGCFNFLVGNGFVPHVLLERSPEEDPEQFVQPFADALRRFANRYSIQTIRSWRFELLIQWGSAESFDSYLNLFKRVSDVLEPYGIEMPLIGPGIFPDQKASNLRAFLREARMRGIRLGTVSIACRPGSVGMDASLVRTADRRYLRNQVMLAREVMAEEGFDPNLLMVGSWRDSLETHNIMNDSCYEGANIMQTVLTAWDMVGSLCYDTALDLSPFTGAGDAFLSGRPGLMSRDGIPKPSYHAFDFLTHVNRHLVHASDRCLASTNDMGNFQMVCHNCERLNAAYLATPERLLAYQLFNTYFEERRERRLRIRITGAKPGTYLVKARFVNADGGSVGDEAQRMRMWCMDEPSRSEVAHLKAASQPQMRLERLHSLDGTLEFTHIMKSNEIAYFHVIFLY